MNPDNFKLASVLIGDTYAQQGASSLRMQEKLVQNLLTQVLLSGPPTLFRYCCLLSTSSCAATSDRCNTN